MKIWPNNVVAVAWPIFLLAGSLSADRPLYIQSPQARLLSEARMDSAGPSLTRGTMVTQIGEQGMFYRVRAPQGTGFVPKIFASSFAPGEKADLGKIDRNAALRARPRASNYSQTAAARGISESERLRVRGNLSEFDFDSILWIEQLSADPALLESFRKGESP